MPENSSFDDDWVFMAQEWQFCFHRSPPHGRAVPFKWFEPRRFGEVRRTGAYCGKKKNYVALLLFSSSRVFVLLPGALLFFGPKMPRRKLKVREINLC